MDRLSRRLHNSRRLTFRAEINYVEVDARVLDAQGKFVTDLKPEDFEVFEDRRPQKVTAFSLVNIPVERQQRPLFASKPVEPDVRNNLQGADGRIYLLVLDDLHTTGVAIAAHETRGRMFIERYIGANDLAAVIHTAGPQRRQPGLHQQPAAAAAGGRQVHGQEAPVVDA